MKKKDKLFTVSNIIILVVIVFGVYSLITLKNYINNLDIKWDNATYQVVSQLVIVFFISVALTMITNYIYHVRVLKNDVTINSLDEELASKNKSIEELNNRLAKSRLYDFNSKVWSIDILDEYIKQMYEKNIGIFTVINIKSNSDEISKSFLAGMKLLNDPKIIVFRRNELEYTLLCIKLSNKDVVTNSSFFKAKDITITSQYTFDTSKSDKDKVLSQIKGESHE